MKRGVVRYFILFVLSLLPYVVQAQRTDDAVVQLQKLNRVYRHLYNGYVDSVGMESLVESGIRAMLEELDPHSVYLDKRELKSAQEAMEGEFSGIGVEYNILLDTIVVVNTVVNGPAEKVGVMPNDRIVEVDGESVVGVERAEVPPKLRGEKGTVVNVGVRRRGVKDMLHFSITRDLIPITTVDAAYKIADSVGYVKINRFGRTTMQEFEQAMEQLDGINTLVLDLSNNGGGLLDQAVELAGYFIPRDSLVVFTEGRSVEPRYYYAKDGGRFDGRLIVVINEASASGSEIVAGAVQDWDRGLLVGQDSFGKGLVQSQIPLGDGSAIRLTIARYHTPSGRVIQRPYVKGDKQGYYNAQVERVKKSGDDTTMHQRALFKTLRLKRDVYADGGIRPDVVVVRDTTIVSDYMVRVVAQGVYNDFMMDYMDGCRDSLKRCYPTFDKFDSEYHLSDEELQRVVNIATKKGVEYDEQGYMHSRELMRNQLSALVAQRLFSTSEYYRYINPRVNENYKRVIALIENWAADAGSIIKSDL